MLVAEFTRDRHAAAAIGDPEPATWDKGADPREQRVAGQSELFRIGLGGKRGEQRIIVAAGRCEHSRIAAVAPLRNERARQRQRIEVDLGAAAARLAEPRKVEKSPALAPDRLGVFSEAFPIAVRL